jgi:hypothetical protein
VSLRPPELDDLARRIVEFHLQGRHGPSHHAEGIEAAFRRLHDVVTRLIGPGGFRAVMERAVHLSRAECPWLEGTAVVVDTTVVLRDLAGVVEREGPERVKDGAVVLFGTVISLLRTLIGDGLTLSLVSRSWRELEGVATDSQEGSP